MIIDGHAHCFPRLGSASGGEPARLHLDLIQHHVQFHVQGFRRKSDGKRVEGSPLMPTGDAIADMPDANLRVGRYGRLECTVDGQDYFLQWYPPSQQDMAAPPEMMICQMDYVGVDKAVVQHDHVYGRLDDFLLECTRRYPGRFLPLAQVREWADDLGPELRRLDRCVREYGFVGLYFAVEPLSIVNFAYHLDDRRYEPLWDLVLELEVPVFWYLYTGMRDKYGSYIDQLRRLERWAAAHPDIPSVYTHGIETIAHGPRETRFDVPREWLDCLRHPNMHVELMLHLMAPDTEYPYAWARPMLKMLRDDVGPEKLVWGSDMPAAERGCTYQQSMDYFRLHCDFMSEGEKALFFGGNLGRVLGERGRGAEEQRVSCPRP